jgi:hypothetical protein
LYGKLLGVAPYVDEAYYVGFPVEDQEVGLDPHGHSQGTTWPVGYWHVDDIHDSLKPGCPWRGARLPRYGARLAVARGRAATVRGPAAAARIWLAVKVPRRARR